MSEDDVEEDLGFFGLISIVVVIILLLLSFLNKDKLPKQTDKPSVCECCKNTYVESQD